MDNDDMAMVRKVGGKVVMDDPTLRGAIRAADKHKCQAVFQENLERIRHFKQRISERGDNPEEVVIIILNADDEWGGIIADVLMPGTDWQSIRDQGQVPFARGLVGREFMQDALEGFDQEAAEKLKILKGTVVIVVDFGVADVFTI